MSENSLQIAEVNVENLSLSRGGRVLFSELNLALKAGECVIVRGANGSGKTSLMRAIAGFCELETGRIDVTPGHDSLGFLGHQLGLKSNETVKDCLSFWQNLAGQNQARRDQTMKTLALGHLQRRLCGQLSAGQKQRVTLARLVLSNRAIWLMDEPAAPLDARNRERLREIVAAHRANGGIVIAATHVELDWPDTQMLELTQ